MTRRERLAAKLEKRERWANGHRERADVLLASTRKYDGDFAFNTQPGHIPERSRVIARQDRAFDHLCTAQHHDAKANGLADQLDRSVFSDDGDAIEQLEARIAEREAERDRIKAYNATCRAAVKAGRKMGDTSLLDEWQRADLKSCAVAGQLRAEKGCPFPGYVLSNLGGRIAADRERIQEICRRQERATAAAEAGGVKILRSDGWCTVTFAEKPSRVILDALRAAGYAWGAGSWSGYLDRLPAEVAALEGLAQ